MKNPLLTSILTFTQQNALPHIPICITADGLYPTQPFFDICRKNNWSFIVTFQDGNLPSVWKEIEALQGVTNDNKCSHTVSVQDDKIRNELCWINGIDYQGHKPNWIKSIEFSKNIKGNNKKSTRFVHLSDIEINRSNIREISLTGRLRWKIENEGFNTQKNHGYNLQYKYSRSNYTATKNYHQYLLRSK